MIAAPHIIHTYCTPSQNVPIFTSVVVVGVVIILVGLVVAMLFTMGWWGRRGAIASDTADTRGRARSRSRARTLSLPGLTGPWIWADLHAPEADRQPQPQPDPQHQLNHDTTSSKVPQPVMSSHPSQLLSSPLLTQELPHAYLVSDETLRYTHTNDHWWKNEEIIRADKNGNGKLYVTYSATSRSDGMWGETGQVNVHHP